MYHATMVYTVALTCFNGPVERRSDPQGSTKVFVRHVASRAAEEAGDIKPQQRCCRYIFIHMQICIHMQLYETSIASSCGGQVTFDLVDLLRWSVTTSCLYNQFLGSCVVCRQVQPLASPDIVSCLVCRLLIQLPASLDHSAYVLW